jgi:hypothetical protein
MHTLPIQLGGLSIQLRSEDTSFDELAAIYASFRAEAAQVCDLVADVELLSVDPRTAQTSEARALLPSIESYFQRTLTLQPNRDRVIQQQAAAASAYLLSPRFVACLREYQPTSGRWTSFGVSQSGAWFMNEERGEARIFLTSNEDEKVAVRMDRYVYILLRGLLTRHRGVLLHASAVVDGDGSYIFVGPSGSGKTTIAAAAQALGWPILADDGSIVRQMAPGEFWAFRTPWNMLPAPWSGSFGKRPDCAIIDGIFFIEPDGVDRWERLRPAASAVRLVQSAFLTLKQVEREDAPYLFEWLTQLGIHVPCYALHFTASCDFLRVIGHAAQKGRERT